MASTGSATPTVSVEDIAAMSDADLAEFMKKHRSPSGDYELSVDGFEKLPEDERGKLAERLKAQQQGLAQSPKACPRSIDPDDLDGRLQQVLSSNASPVQLESQTIDCKDTPPFDPKAARKEKESYCYHELVNDGGRPAYPIDLFEDILEHPSKYREISKYWEYPYMTGEPGILGRQYEDWKAFRRWQTDNRSRNDEIDFPAYVEQEKLFAPHNYKREHNCNGFGDHVEEVKSRLAHHGFTRPFELDEDPKKQDQLTTWIEYLNYECCWLDEYTRVTERLNPDKGWQKLVDLKIPSAKETMENILSSEMEITRSNEIDHAWDMFIRFRSEVESIKRATQEDPKRWQIPEERQISAMKSASDKLRAAESRLTQVQSRNVHISRFHRNMVDYEFAEKNIARLRALLQWILKQISLIEDEMGVNSGCIQ